jgi:hypothetical protein
MNLRGGSIADAPDHQSGEAGTTQTFQPSAPVFRVLPENAAARLGVRAWCSGGPVARDLFARHEHRRQNTTPIADELSHRRAFRDGNHAQESYPVRLDDRDPAPDLRRRVRNHSLARLEKPMTTHTKKGASGKTRPVELGTRQDSFPDARKVSKREVTVELPHVAEVLRLHTGRVRLLVRHVERGTWERNTIVTRGLRDAILLAHSATLDGTCAAFICINEVAQGLYLRGARVRGNVGVPLPSALRTITETPATKYIPFLPGLERDEPFARATA